jgi:hypothetical protein
VLDVVKKKWGKNGIKFKEVVSRITGFSVPVFGVSCNPPQPEVITARRALAFLEDRRVLLQSLPARGGRAL